MIHQKFDGERWKNLFSLEKLRKQARDYVEGRRRQLPGEYKSAVAVERHVKLMSPGGEIITSPLHLAVVEQVREECLGRSQRNRIERGKPSASPTCPLAISSFWAKKEARQLS